MFRRSLSSVAPLLVLTVSAGFADPLSRKIEIDFFRDVPSRNLKALATRSDGRLVAGPTLTELAAPAPADLLWCLEPGGDPNRWLIGTGPDGRIVEVTLDLAASTFSARDVVKLTDPQVFAVWPLADGSILAGTSPRGALYLIREGAPVARVGLPVDSIFDLYPIGPDTVLAATGNPGRVYRIELGKFAAGGVAADKITDTATLAHHGISLFGEIRDRNVRRLAGLADGRIAAGSSPRGNIYAFPAAGGPPVILQENRDAEVTDLLPQPNGDLYATIVHTATSQESRLTPIAAASKAGTKEETPPPATAERFAGRSTLVWFPAHGFPEVLTARANTAFYRVVRRGDTLLLAGGEQGELLGYDLKARLSLTYAGSLSSQLNGLAPLSAATPGDAAGAPERFLVLRNNAPGLAVLDFGASGPREAETRRLDLAGNWQLGALRFNRLRHLSDGTLAPQLRTSNGSDDVEGWGPWTALSAAPDSGWRSEGLRGRYVKLRIRLLDAPGGGAPAAGFEIDRATLFGLPQNRRPQLQDFRILSPGYAIIPASEPAPSAVVSLSQILQAPKDDDRRRSAFLSSQVVPSRGTQVALWTLTDPDGDTVLSTFSIRRDGDTEWIDMVTGTKDGFAQFDTRNLPDGLYFTRLVATETAPRSAAERLTHIFETDDLVIDHTPPELIEATARRTENSVVVVVHGRDRLSLLDGIEVVFNNNLRETVEQPADGVRDGREERFILEVPLARVSNATSLEVTLYDAAGNGTARRLYW